MEDIVRLGMLYDFYGELLTDHQKKIMEAVVMDDMTYSEIAAEQQISRQGVFDLVRRCSHILESYEKKLSLLDKFLEVKKQVAEIDEEARAFLKDGKSERIESIRQKAGEILTAI